MRGAGDDALCARLRTAGADSVWNPCHRACGAQSRGRRPLFVKQRHRAVKQWSIQHRNYGACVCVTRAGDVRVHSPPPPPTLTTRRRVVALRRCATRVASRCRTRETRAFAPSQTSSCPATRRRWSSLTASRPCMPSPSRRWLPVVTRLATRRSTSASSWGTAAPSRSTAPASRVRRRSCSPACTCCPTATSTQRGPSASGCAAASRCGRSTLCGRASSQRSARTRQGSRRPRSTRRWSVVAPQPPLFV